MSFLFSKKLLLSLATLMVVLYVPLHAEAQNAAIAVRPDGEVDVVNGFQDEIMYFWGTSASQWNSTWLNEWVGQNGSGETAIGVRSTGEAIVVWQGPNNALEYAYAFSPTPASQWSVGQIAGAGSVYSAPAIAVRSTVAHKDEVDVVWQGANNTLEYAHASSPSLSFTVNQIAGPGSTYSSPAIGVRSTDEAVVVWLGVEDSMQYAHATPGSSWSFGQIAAIGTAYSAPAIAVRSTAKHKDEVDVVYLGWNDAVEYGFALSPGLSFNVAPIPGSKYDTSLASSPAIAVRSTDEVDVVWLDGDNGYNDVVEYAFAMPGLPWSSPTIIGYSVSSNSSPAIAVRPDGEADVVVTFYNGTYYIYDYWATPGSGWTQTILAQFPLVQ
jgi:hypothetical protein